MIQKLNNFHEFHGMKLDYFNDYVEEHPTQSGFFNDTKIERN